MDNNENNENNNVGQEAQPGTGMVSVGDLNNESVIDIIVEYNEESDYTTVFITPNNMEGVNPSVIKIDNEDFISLEGDELTECLKNLIVRNNFDEIEAITSEMRDAKYIEEGSDHSEEIDKLTALIAEQITQQIERDKKRHKEMLDNMDIDFTVDNIRSGISVYKNQPIDDINFTVNINGDLELDPNTPLDQAPPPPQEEPESLSETNASIGLLVAGRNIPLGDLSYFYGISKGGTVGITAKDIRKSDLMEDLRHQVRQLIEDGVFPPPKGLIELIMVNKLVKAINNETAKHFGVEHDKLKDDPEQQKMFRFQVDQGMTLDEALQALWLEKEMKKAEAQQQEKSPEKDIEEDILKEFGSPSM